MADDYDVFISHATEDKEDVARPLADELVKRGRTVWYDEIALKVGDSVPRGIAAGLSSARFGVVILSPSFFAKPWTQHERDGLTVLEMNVGARKRILPVWHGVSKDEVARYSPGLAAKLAVDTSQGIAHVADAIDAALNEPEPTPLIPTTGQSEEAEVELMKVCEWADRAAIRAWSAWTEGLFWPNPFLAVDDDERLKELSQWLAGRYWPNPEHRITLAVRTSRSCYPTCATFSTETPSWPAPTCTESGPSISPKAEAPTSIILCPSLSATSV